MDFMNKIDGVAESHERATRVNVILPTVDFVVALEIEIDFAILCLDEQTVRPQVCPVNIGNVREE